MTSEAMRNDPLLTRKDAARYLTDLGLETAPQTLARKFHEGTGPLCTHVGERAMYRQSHLDAYFSEQVSAPRRSSSEPRRPGKLPTLADVRGS
jgi:hypothetical protein